MLGDLTLLFISNQISFIYEYSYLLGTYPLPPSKQQMVQSASIDIHLFVVVNSNFADPNLLYCKSWCQHSFYILVIFIIHSFIFNFIVVKQKNEREH